MWHLTNIPKIAYFYWDTSPMPFLRWLSLYSFRKFNPDWEMKLLQPINGRIEPTWSSFENKTIYLGEDYLSKYPINNLQIINCDMEEYGFSNEISDIYKSDILRINFLILTGGIWSDLDILYWKSIYDLSFNQFNKAEIKNVLCCNFNGHSTGFLMSEKDSKIFIFLKFILSETRYNENSYQSFGPDLFNEFLAGRDFFNLPFKEIYPLDYRYIIPMCNQNLFIEENGNVGIHWYAGHSVWDNFVNNINKDNYKEMQNTLVQYIDRIFEEGE